MHGKYRHAGPKSTQYNELEKMINQYYDMLQRKRHENAKRYAVNIRKTVLLNGCPEDDIIAETNANSQSQQNLQQSNSSNNGHPQPTGGDVSGRRLLTRIGRALPTIVVLKIHCAVNYGD